MSWDPGETIVLRQVWQERPLFAFPCVVVSDEPDLLVTYLPERAPFGAITGWPGGDPHPWANRGHWQGHGTLMLRRPSDRYSIWVFWQGAQRKFECWYVNFEEPYRRSPIGIDSLDHELDLWSEDGATWHRKDEEGVPRCVAEGRFDELEAERIRGDADAFEAVYAREGPWWDLSWATWHRKDEEGVPRCVAEGRFDEREAERIRGDADAFEAVYAREGPWWDLSWASWRPHEIPEVVLPADWALVPAA